jgi:hypothetical protein
MKQGVLASKVNSYLNDIIELVNNTQKKSHNRSGKPFLQGPGRYRVFCEGYAKGKVIVIIEKVN